MVENDFERRMLTATEIEGLMTAGYCEGASLDLGGDYHIVCVDGEVWTLETADNECVGTLNPTNAVVCEEIRNSIQQLLTTAERPVQL